MLDEVAGLYYCKNDITISLTNLEVLLLNMLISNKGKVVLAKTIQKELLTTDGGVRHLIKRLRRKLGNEFKIYNKRGVGYYID